MKKILALIMAIAMLGGVSAYAQTIADNADVDLTAEELIDVSIEPELFLDKVVTEGVVKSISDEQIEIEGLVLNIDENTLVANTELIPVQVKEGDLITAVVSTMTTRSLPPQSYAYYIIARENAETLAPIYMSVDKVEDGFIYSQDGNYEVSFENAEVGMYRTKNIVKAEELTKGSDIFVYADIMTMSIPALVNPTKIVIMNIAQPQETTTFSKAEALSEEGILLGTDKGLELDREVTRAEAVTLVQRTTASDKKVYVSSFDDVAETHWAYSTISWAVESKIVQGVGDNKFEPDKAVTAKELAMMLLNAQGEEIEFDNAFSAAIKKGLVTEEDGIAENDVLTRDAVAKIIYNYYIG